MRPYSNITREALATILSLPSVHENRILVAVSGGIDSMVLLHLLKRETANISLELHVAHVHHGLRGVAADEDANFVREQAELLGLPFHLYKAVVEPNGEGIEAAARDTRYSALESIATRIGAQYIAVAHNADDIAETFLMNLARGSGVNGLGSHAKIRPCGNATIVRPFHGVTRAEIEEWAKMTWFNGKTIQWREDETNKDTRFLRNRVRHKLMPVMREVFGDDIGLSIRRSSDLMRKASGIIDATIEDLGEFFHSADDTNNEVWIDTVSLASLDKRVVDEVLRRVTRRLAKMPITYNDTKRISRLVTAEVGKKETLSQHLMATREKKAIRISVVRS